MTGIERLHDIAYDGPYSGGMVHISVQKLREICEQIEREVDDISECEFDVLAFVEEKGGLDEVKKRLMPEGMEWPRYADGALVEIGDEVVGPDYGESIRVDEVTFHANGFTLLSKNGGGKWYEIDDRFKRPAKVLDADGVEIRVADTVWHAKTGAEYRVLSLPDMDKGAWVTTKTNPADRLFLGLAVLTHRAPVLAADGRPLREGETVYDINDAKGYPGTVASTELDRFGHVKITCEEPVPASVYIHPSRLTHERPDSWERWEADLRRSEMCEEACDDLVRRAKALAERGK